MKDTVREIAEEKRGALVTFEGGETLWFSRDAWREHAPISIGAEEDVDGLKAWLLPRQYPEALNYAVSLLAVRARASGEIRQKLRQRRYMDDTIEMVEYKLEKEKLLDDEAFAREWRPPAPGGDGQKPNLAGAAAQGNFPGAVRAGA